MTPHSVEQGDSVVIRFFCDTFNLCFSLFELFLDGGAVLFAVVIVCGIDGEFFEAAELVDDVLDAAFGYGQERPAILHIFDILIKATKLYAHLFADGIVRCTIASAVQSRP